MLHEVAHAALLCRLHWLQPNVLMSYLVYGTWQQLCVVMLSRRNGEGKGEFRYDFNLLMSGFCVL